MKYIVDNQRENKWDKKDHKPGTLLNHLSHNPSGIHCIWLDPIHIFNRRNRYMENMQHWKLRNVAHKVYNLRNLRGIINTGYHRKERMNYWRHHIHQNMQGIHRLGICNPCIEYRDKSHSCLSRARSLLRMLCILCNLLSSLNSLYLGTEHKYCLTDPHIVIYFSYKSMKHIYIIKY